MIRFQIIFLWNKCSGAGLENWNTSTGNSLYTIQHNDYKEFSELCLLYLDGLNYTNFSLQRPSALLKARCMAKLLHSTKIVLLQCDISPLPPGTITSKRQHRKLHDFVTFVCLIYSSWWNTCTNAVDAPWTDFFLFKKALQYQAVNPTVSKSVITALSPHLWYLTTESVPFSNWHHPVYDTSGFCCKWFLVHI